MATTPLEEDSEESDLDSSSSVSSGRKTSRKMNLPATASEWKYEHLQELGVHYEDEATSLQNIYSRLMKDSKYNQVPNISVKLMEWTKEFLSVSLNLRSIKRVQIDETLSMVEESMQKILPMLNDFMGNAEKKDIVLISAWHYSLLNFMKNMQRFLVRFTEGVREASYTNLFMLFTKICLMEPESGDIYKGIRTVKGVDIHSIPDVRFVGGIPGKPPMGLILVTEVNKYDSFRGDFKDETFCHGNLSNHVLGRHGIELLVENRCSLFWPCVAGIIGIGTQVIFTYLDISIGHLRKLEENKSTDGEKARIMYTRPYDFMDESDRSCMLDMLFWLGFVQTSSYKLFYPLEK